MNKSNISFYGYNDGKAMTIYTCIMLFVPTVISFCLSIIVSIVAICLNNYYLLFVWILPGILLLTHFLNYVLTNYNDKVFKVIFHLKDGIIRETYFGWMYKERSILKVKKTIKKLEKCINYINLISKKRFID